MFRESFPHPSPEEENKKIATERSGLSYLPEKAREKILRVLRKDLKREDLDTGKTVGQLVDFAEAGEEAKLGEAIVTPEVDKKSGYEVFDEKDRWAQTISLSDEAANESNLPQDKKFA